MVCDWKEKSNARSGSHWEQQIATERKSFQNTLTAKADQTIYVQDFQNFCTSQRLLVTIVNCFACRLIDSSTSILSRTLTFGKFRFRVGGGDHAPFYFGRSSFWKRSEKNFRARKYLHRKRSGWKNWLQWGVYNEEGTVWNERLWIFMGNFASTFFASFYWVKCYNLSKFCTLSILRIFQNAKWLFCW